jgi:hypothetical protein
MKTHTTYRHAVLHEDVGIHDGDKLVQQVRLRVKQLWGQLLHHGLQLLCRVGRDTIPRLRLPPGERQRESMRGRKSARCREREGQRARHNKSRIDSFLQKHIDLTVI